MGAKLPGGELWRAKLQRAIPGTSFQLFPKRMGQKEVKKFLALTRETFFHHVGDNFEMVEMAVITQNGPRPTMANSLSTIDSF